ncbi:MAG: hypothetical protein EPGJADBJ_03414 [Saprospiraceae bacterium]|nr:hypothetical protein [Saprospiraceae bacterium]
MPTPGPIPPNLVRALQNRECILLLGPDAPTLERDGKKVSLQTLLVEHLTAELKSRNSGAALVARPSLAYVAKMLEDAIIVQEVQKKATYSRENARAELNDLIAAFYDQYSFADFPVYRQVAQMPFHFIVETTPAPYLAQALDDENKFDARCIYYHYTNPTHNNGTKISENEIRPDAPLVYQLFGSTEQPDSMIVTERDQLAFIDTLLQQENTAGIPNSIAIHFTSLKDKNATQQFDKTFLILGFDFNEWQLRLIMYLIGRYQRQKETFALQNPQDIAELTAFFYKNNFDVGFVDTPAEQFLADFDKALRQPAVAAAPASNKLNFFLMYAPEDEAVKATLDAQLNPLKKTEFIETWDESLMLAGAEKDAEIAGRLEAADIVLLLVTANFFGSEDIFNRQLATALRRHEAKQTVVIPLLMRSCSWEGTPLDQLTTILPRNRMALDKQDNPDTALSDTVEQLRGWCKKIFDRKKLTR